MEQVAPRSCRSCGYTNPDIIYTPALSDIGNTYVFELTANAIAHSTPVTTSVTVTFVRSPDVDAGNALSICQNGDTLEPLYQMLLHGLGLEMGP